MLNRTRPWETIPVASVAPAAVQAMRARRVALKNTVQEYRDAVAQLRWLIDSPTTSEENKALARELLIERGAK